ncbi:MAG TPA: HD domain-containing phosphohydrolase [Candidatus Dormibacteraeota bacterium]|jgi:putative two-component system response regulator|nr:HD domain-containing phosphohydrolase [Candidatus Dormibacteraeota bacterium]
MSSTVLVVDDDPTVRKFMRLSLEHDGFDVLTCGDGAQAVSLLASETHIDVLLSDYHLPGVNGLELVAVAHRMDPGLPSIMVTGSAEFDVAVKAMSAGAIGYLVKPFTRDLLRITVSRACERRRLSEDAIRLRMVVPMLERFTMMLADVVEARDIETHAHCRRLVAMSDRIAEAMAIPEGERHSIRLGACLHDVGKIAVPDAILHKAGPLEPHEWETMRSHPELGASLMEGVEQWRKARTIVRHHHERFDGSGYPDRLAGQDIPIGARIVAVSDAVDVMINGRPYSPPRSPEHVIEEVRAHRGRQFDPEVADVFLTIAGSDPMMEQVLRGYAAPMLSLTA